MSLLYCGGALTAYREDLRRAGGVEAAFPGNIDMEPYLRKNELCFYIDSGCVDVRLHMSTQEIYEPIGYLGGSLLLEEMLWVGACPAICCKALPAAKGVRGLILPRKNLQRCARAEEVGAALLRLTQAVSAAHMANAVLFHQGDGLRRVCNYLWSYEAARRESGAIPPVTQERIAHKTMLSKSQVTRVLTQLRREGLVSTGYRAIQIADPEGLQTYLSFELL